MFSSGQSSEVLRGVDRLHALLLSKDSKEEKEAEVLLWSALGSPHPSTAQALACLVVALVEEGKLVLPHTISRLLASLSHGLPYTGIVAALGSLLQLQAGTAESFTSPYAISARQHPFISVLRSTPAAWALVLDQCEAILMKPNGLAVLRPFLLYLYCDPAHHDHLGAIRSCLLDRLIQMGRKDETSLAFLNSLLPWQRLNVSASLPETSRLIRRVVELCLNANVSQAQTDSSSILPNHLLLLAALTLAEVQQGLSPVATLSLLEQALDKSEASNWDGVLLLLNKALAACPLPHQAAILDLCLRLLQDRRVSHLPTAALVATCLQDLALPSPLQPAITATKAELVRLFYKMERSVPADMVEVKTPFQRDVSEVLETANLMRKLETPGGVENWLSATSSQALSSLKHMFPLLAALFLTREEPGEAVLSLQLLLKSVKQEPSLAPSLLTLITHRLGRNPAPRLTLALLHALPSMASDKGCIALIMKLVSSLSSRPSVAPLRLSLLVRLWKVETRCFPLLQVCLFNHFAINLASQAALAQKNVSGTEWQVAQAVAVREVVTSHATQYGSDLLPLLSDLINQAEGEEGATAASLALEGIAVLCKEGVIDMRTTVKVTNKTV